eukprot:363493-Hanusia_phi.AAC.2
MTLLGCNLGRSGLVDSRYEVVLMLNTTAEFTSKILFALNCHATNARLCSAIHQLYYLTEGNFNIGKLEPVYLKHTKKQEEEIETGRGETNDQSSKRLHVAVFLSIAASDVSTSSASRDSMYALSQVVHPRDLDGISDLDAPPVPPPVMTSTANCGFQCSHHVVFPSASHELLQRARHDDLLPGVSVRAQASKMKRAVRTILEHHDSISVIVMDMLQVGVGNRDADALGDDTRKINFADIVYSQPCNCHHSASMTKGSQGACNESKEVHDGDVIVCMKVMKDASTLQKTSSKINKIFSALSKQGEIKCYFPVLVSPSGRPLSPQVLYFQLVRPSWPSALSFPFLSSPAIL